MTIIGFNYTKLNATKSDLNNAGKIHVSHKLGVKNVEEQEMSIAADKSSSTIKVSFTFGMEYTPNVGSIDLEGYVILLVTKEEQKSIISGWKQKGQVPKNLVTQIMTTVFAKGQMQAILLAKELNLPSPVPLPKLKIEQTPETKK